MENEKFPEGKMAICIQEKKLLLPPFLMYPLYNRYSMGWRMGSGEGYVMKFRKWFRQFSEEEQELYIKLFPAPISIPDYWNESFDVNGNCPEEYTHKKLFAYRWEITGCTKYTMTWFRKTLQTEPQIRFRLFENALPYGKRMPDVLSAWSPCCFVPLCFPEEEAFYSASAFILYAKALFSGKQSLINRVRRSNGNAEVLSALAFEINSHPDKEWDRIFPGMLALAQYFKFSQNQDLREFLLSTDNDILLCLDSKDLLLGCRIILNETTGKQEILGENLLGFAIMNARDEIRKIYGNIRLCENSE